MPSTGTECLGQMIPVYHRLFCQREIRLSMQTEAREALAKLLGSLQYVRRVPRQSYRRTILQFVPLQLDNGFKLLRSADTTAIVLNLFDHTTHARQRLLATRFHRALLETLVRLMIATPTQWNAFYDELWQPELLQRLRAPFEAFGIMFPDQRSVLEARNLPAFVLRMTAEELSDDDFESCYQFLTCPSAQVLNSEQQGLLDRAERGITQRQIVVELELELADCKPTEELWMRLQRLLKRVEAADRSDLLAFPVRFKIETLRIGMSVFAVACDMAALMDLSSISGICVQNLLSNQCDSPQERWAESLEDFPPQVLLDPSARVIDLSWLTLTDQHVSSVCSALRATGHIEQVSFLRRRGPDTNIHNLKPTAFWAWIAFGILHRDSKSRTSVLDVGGMVGTTESTAIVSRILVSLHPGKELVMAIDPGMEIDLETNSVPLPAGKQQFASLRAATELKKSPNNRSATVFATLNSNTAVGMRWEVLVKLNNGWTCILVPAYGIAWVSTSSVIMEHESPSLIDAGDTMQSNTWLKTFSWSYTRREHALQLLSMIGHSLESLSLEHDTYASEHLESILNSCPNLKRMKLHGNTSASVLLLQRAYQEGRCMIERLCISLDTDTQRGFMNEVALLLGDPSSKPLRQLIIDLWEDDMATGVDNLIAACRTNKTLESLQVHIYGKNWQPVVQAKLDQLNGHILAIYTPNVVKWAFLSVVKHHRVENDGSSMNRFDSLIISRIFELAGSPIRRKCLALRY